MRVREKGKFISWLKKRKKIIIICLIIWSIIVIVNYIIGNSSKQVVEDTPITTYTPHTPVDEAYKGIISSKTKEDETRNNKIDNLFEDFVNFCNNKEYDKAYSLLTDDCKYTVFNNNVEEFRDYIIALFDTEKIYDIQSLSSDKIKYVYRLRLLDNFLANGVKSKSELTYKEQQVTVHNSNDEYKLSIYGFVETRQLNKEHTDPYLEVSISNVEVYYGYEIYNVTIKNNSDYTVILADGLDTDEVFLNVGDETRGLVEESIFNVAELRKDVVVSPNTSKTFRFKFIKFFDEYIDSKSVVFNKVRIVNNYLGAQETLEHELTNAVDTLSFEITF